MFNFGIDDSGNYGYIKDGAATVTPFKQGFAWYTDEVIYASFQDNYIDYSVLLPDHYKDIQTTGYIVRTLECYSSSTAYSTQTMHSTYDSTTGIVHWHPAYYAYTAGGYSNTIHFGFIAYVFYTI